MIQNLKHEYFYIKFCIGCTDLARFLHYREALYQINGEMIAEAISQVTDNPIIKTKGKITLPPRLVSVIGVKMPPLHNTNDVYEINFNTFQLPEGVILLDILHKVNHKMQQNLSSQYLFQTIVLQYIQMFSFGNTSADREV